MDQLPRLGKRELICLLSFTCNYVVFVWRGFLFLWVLGMGYVILLWHSLSLPYNYFKEDNVYSMTAILPYGPPVNTDIDYYRTLFYSDFFFVSVAMLVVRYLLGEECTSKCLSYNAEHQARYHFNAFGIAWPGFEPTTSRSRSRCSTTEPPGPV